MSKSSSKSSRRVPPVVRFFKGMRAAGVVLQIFGEESLGLIEELKEIWKVEPKNEEPFSDLFS